MAPPRADSPKGRLPARGGRRDTMAIGLFCLAFAGLALLLDNSYYLLILTMVAVWAVMGLSWNLFSGFCGLISFGHAAFFGLGAYLVALLLEHGGVSPWLGIPLAAAAGMLAGLLIGLPTFRLRGHYFALAMLAYPLALLYVFEWLGYQEVALPMRREAPWLYMQFEGQRAYAFLALGLLLPALAATAALARSRFGMSLLAIKQDEDAAEAVGIDTLRWKLAALGLSAALAGAAGGFYAVVLLVVTPLAVFGMLASAQALIIAMFGGVGTLWGPVLGAVILVPLSELLHARYASDFPGIQGVIYGVAIIAVILLAPEGLLWKLRALGRRGAFVALGASGCRPDSGADPALLAPAPGEGSLLEVRDLSKSFGGLRAARALGFSVRRGELLGIIGPNGAGKTTLFNLLNGFLKADAGEVRFRGRSLRGLRPNRVCRAGIARTFQVPRPFPRLTVFDNVVIGAYVRARSNAEAGRLASAALKLVGLDDRVQAPAGTLSNRELRLMELARALASCPSLLLVDEILAGLDPGAMQDMVSVLRKVNGLGITIVIIEHSMRAMVKLVDRFIVLDHGALLAQGTPEEVVRDPRVIEAYLGRKWLEQAET